jgi:hypothetical protein
MLEVLLCTPLTTAEIVRGNMGYLFRRFWQPAMLMVGVDLALVVTLAGQGTMEQSSLLIILELLSLVILFIAECIALAWAGCWLSLKSRRSMRASTGAALRVMALPALMFLGALWMAPATTATPGQTSTGWVLLVTWCGVGCLNAAFWTLQARGNLLNRFRQTASPE